PQPGGIVDPHGAVVVDQQIGDTGSDQLLQHAEAVHVVADPGGELERRRGTEHPSLASQHARDARDVHRAGGAHQILPDQVEQPGEILRGHRPRLPAHARAPFGPAPSRAISSRAARSAPRRRTSSSGTVPRAESRKETASGRPRSAHTSPGPSGPLRRTTAWARSPGGCHVPSRRWVARTAWSEEGTTTRRRSRCSAAAGTRAGPRSTTTVPSSTASAEST